MNTFGFKYSIIILMSSGKTTTATFKVCDSMVRETTSTIFTFFCQAQVKEQCEVRMVKLAFYKPETIGCAAPFAR